MFVSALICLALLGVCYSNAQSFKDVANLDQNSGLIAHVERVFKSDHFMAVGTARHDEHEKLLGTVSAYLPTGSVYQDLYVNVDGTADNTCSYLSSSSGFAVNYCLIAANFAFKFQLTQSSCVNGVTQYFTDKECTNYVGMSSLYVDSQCMPSRNPNYFGQNAYQNIRCLAGGRPAFPSYDFIAEELYDNTKCSGPYVAYAGYTTNKCFMHDGYYSAYDCSTGVPRLNHYTSTSCGGAIASTITYPSTCKAGDTNIGDDDIFYLPPIIVTPPSASTTAYPSQGGAPTQSSLVFCAAHAPTMQPQFWPTAYPTSMEGVEVTFSVEQVLYGIDVNTYLATNLNAGTFAATVASLMTGVHFNDITNIQAASYSRRRLREEKSLQTVQGAAILLTYTVTTTSIYSQTQLWNELSAGVSSGQFNTQLWVVANTNGATVMEGCTSNSIAVPGSNDDGGDNSKSALPLSVGAIIGIVVGVVGGLCLIAALIVWLCVQYRRPKSAMATRGNTDTAPTDTQPPSYPQHAPYEQYAAPAATTTPVPVQNPVSSA